MYCNQKCNVSIVRFSVNNTILSIRATAGLLELLMLVLDLLQVNLHSTASTGVDHALQSTQYRGHRTNLLCNARWHEVSKARLT